jgi:hypothetical protein
VEVEPLVSAELDRRHPERLLLRAGDPAGMRAAWAAVEEFWAGTVQRALRLPEEALHRQVDGEWSFVQTLRHLVFVTDGWLSHAVLGEPRPYHPIGLLATFMTDAASLGVDPAAEPSVAEVLAVRTGRLAAVRSYLAGVTQDELDRPREQPAGGYPPPAARTAAQCLHVVFDEEWAHHRFAVRDLAVVEAG